jgi:hypothetical protein
MNETDLWRNLKSVEPAEVERLADQPAWADLVAEIVLAPSAAAPCDTPVLGLSPPRRRRGVALGSSLTAAAAVAAVIVAVLVPVLGRGAVAPKWVLVGEVSSSWHEVPSAGLTSGFSLTCPSATTCYAEGPSSVEVTTDGGKGWHPEAAGVGLVASPVTCVGSGFCAVLSVKSGKPLFDKTSDGGRAWSSLPGPSGLSSYYGFGGVMVSPGLSDISCSTASACVVVASDSELAPTGAFVTRNGGVNWSTSTMPEDFPAKQVECFAGGRCVSAGEIGGAYSTDSGLTWSAANTGPAFGWPALSCSSASDCTAMFSPVSAAGQRVSVAVSSNGGRSWQTTMAQGLPSGKVFTSISCRSKSDCWAAGDVELIPGGGRGGLLASTTSGAESWRDASLPHGVSGVWAVSCPSPTVCFALASKGPLPTAPTQSAPPTSFVLLAYSTSS